MPTPKRTTTNKRARRERRQAQRAKWKAEHGGTPYHGFADHEERLSDRVVAAMQTRGIDWPTWSKGGAGRKPQRLRVDDLAVGLWAVECVGKKGISYGQLDRCFKECRGVGCHNNKASSIFSTLVDLGLIAKVGNYSASRRGNVYGALQDGEMPPPPPKPMARAHTDAELSNPKPDDDPW